MAKTLSQIRRGLKEVQGPDPKPAMPKGPNGPSNVVREEDEVYEAYRPPKGPVVGNSLGKIEKRVGQQKATGNQNRKPSTYAEEAIARVKQKNGRTLTGSLSPPVNIKPSNQSLTGYH